MAVYTIPRKYVVLGGLLLITLGFYSTSDESSAKRYIWEAYHKGFRSSSSRDDVFKSSPVDSQPIRDICSETNWNQSLIFTCNSNHGGVGNVRNSILNCVRYTIGAGGSLVLPQILEREITNGMGDGHETPVERNGPKLHELDYMFDVNHFSDSLRKSCPELILIRKMSDAMIGDRRKSLLPETLFPNIPTSGIEHPEEWPQRFNNWLEKNLEPASISEKNPFVIDLEPSFLHYPTHSDGHAVAHVFGNILQFRSDIRELATTALGTLVDWYEFPVNITRHGLLKPSFLGAHLETQNPFLEQRHELDIEYSHFEAQSRAYLDISSELQLPIIYAASGNPKDIENLNRDAERLDVAVTHKEDLLDDDDLIKLRKLTYDQRSLVDYLILEKAEAFVGVGHSPFSWNIALAREQIGAVMDGVLDGDIWKDGMNTLFGVRPDYVESSACMWS
ncbi:hypothetical protein EPUL_004715 [Erysiphe pulchra]|uniref:Alternative oxidase n=1 Tax=Erysiphe pulchra TaxID=225359 RepID=A0A2S4PLL8_9PEZI|nr:hypothetical protein EPUL_004715 [Erysiphe pulchra]